jgi:hypothetical protein
LIIQVRKKKKVMPGPVSFPVKITWDYSAMKKKFPSKFKREGVTIVMQGLFQKQVDLPKAQLWAQTNDIVMTHQEEAKHGEPDATRLCFESEADAALAMLALS